MTHSRRLNYSIACSLFAATAAAFAQTPPAPPARLAAPPVAVEAVPPVPPRPAVAPRAPGDFDFNFDFDFQDQIQRIKEVQGRLMELDAPMALAREMSQEQQFELQEQISEARIKAAGARDMAMDFRMRMPFAFAPQAVPPQPPAPAGIGFGPASMKRLTGMGEDSLYSNGQRALDNRKWDEAVEYFSQAAAKAGARADGALYWKAYALRKQGKSSEALAAIAELRKSYASSRWMDDAKALELEAGKPVSPEAEIDEDLKLLALNGIMQNDPERAIPLVENQLKGSASPKVKRNALFVLAQSSNARAQTVVEQIARGGSNPDLQVKAIQYWVDRHRQTAGGTLSEIYAATSDVQVKRAIIDAFGSSKDKDRLLAAAKTEKNMDLKNRAMDQLGSFPGNAELWQLYQSETTVDGKEAILRRMWNNGDADKLLDVVRTEKDPKLRRMAMQVLASQKNASTTDALVQIYNSEQDVQIKTAILDAFAGSSRNAPALIAMAKAEKDQKMKLRIVERLSNMTRTSKEAAAYMEELLK